MGYKGVVKDNVIVLEEDVELPEGAEVEVINKGWWLSDEARRIASDKDASQKWLAECDQIRARIKSESGVKYSSKINFIIYHPHPSLPLSKWKEKSGN